MLNHICYYNLFLPITDGELRQLDKATNLPTDKEFEFNVKSNDHAYNQLHYEALGDVITEHIYELLIDLGLQKISVPTDIAADQATFIFASRPDFTNAEKIIVLIHGSGAVRAGQWARRFAMLGGAQQMFIISFFFI